MGGEFLEALQQIAKEKDIPLDTLIETVEAALATAYKKNNPVPGEVKVSIDSSRGSATPFKVYSEKLVVDEVANDYNEISLLEARKHDPNILAGELLILDVKQGDFGRIAAQTAKQVVVQRIREAERRKVLDEYSEKQGEVVTGVVQRREGRNIIISMGKIDALLPSQEQVESEPYRINDRIKIYVLEVRGYQQRAASGRFSYPSQSDPSSFRTGSAGDCGWRGHYQKCGAGTGGAFQDRGDEPRRQSGSRRRLCGTPWQSGTSRCQRTV